MSLQLEALKFIMVKPGVTMKLSLLFLMLMNILIVKIENLNYEANNLKQKDRQIGGLF